MKDLSTLSLIIILWLAIAVGLTLAWMLLITVRNQWGSWYNFIETILRRYLKP